MIDHRIHVEKGLELASDHPAAFGAWLLLESVIGTALKAQAKIEHWLADADRRALSHALLRRPRLLVDERPRFPR